MNRLAKLDAALIEAMAPYQWAFKLLQTLPGLDEIGAAMILWWRSATITVGRLACASAALAFTVTVMASCRSRI